ncbi:MAG: EAL domain-containing protein [Sphingomonadales bacterium]|nr:EAL domain-containing protein [Sphingomonadales bacterium]
MFHAALVSLSWCVPLLAFPAYGAPAQSIGYAAAAIALIGATPVVFAAVPLAGLLCCAIAGAGLAGAMHLIGYDNYAWAAIAYAAVNAVATALHGRKTITRLRGEIARNAQQELVDMLLRQNSGEQSDWLWQIDGRKCILDPSSRFAEAAGTEQSQLEGMPLLRLLGGAAWDEGRVNGELRDFAARLQRGRTFSDYMLRINLAGEDRWWKISGAPRIAPEGHISGYRGVMADVTESEANERETHHMAHFDALTGLANRSHINQLLQDQIQSASDGGKISAFLMIDLDRFKAINDTLGHPIGDELLKMVGARLESLTRPGDRCGRLGGDEFAMVIADVDSSHMLDERARQIITRLSQPYEVDGHVLHIGASAGSALYPKDGRSAPTLLRNADLALYRAKESGRGIHASYEPLLSRKAERRRAIELALRKAIEKDEFTLVYQPVMTLGLRDPAGFEALLRWRNDELGLVPPAEFLPIAEETRLIDSIGAWVFRHACKEAADWPERYRLAINLSAGQLRNPRLAEIILAALRQSGLAPKRLEIETTEAVLNTDNNSAFETFDILQKRGVTVALDDFGTGYSTLSMIGQARFTSIKIDKSFIHRAEHGSEASTAVIKAVIAMADSLGIATIVEGIESDDQLSLAASLGCRQAQGFFLGRPMPAEAVRAHIGMALDEAAA